MTTYTIKPGDTLLEIAIEQGVEYVELLALNPQYQNDPNYIRAGDTLALPKETKIEEVEPDYSVEPPSKNAEPKATGQICDKPECRSIEVKDVLFITGDAPTNYYCLDEEQQTKLKQEISFTDKLIQDYKTILENAPKEGEADSSKLTEHALKKKAWLEQCVYAGAISLEEPNQATARQPSNSPVTQAYIKSKLAELNKRRAIVDGYVPFFSQSSADTLRDKVLERIDRDITYWKTLENKPPTAESSNKQTVNLNKFNAKTMEHKPASRHVVEAWLVSENRLVYLRVDFFKKAKTSWKSSPVNTEVNKALKAKDWKGLKQGFINDIKAGVSNIESTHTVDAVFANWKADGWKAHEWKATQRLHDENGEVVFAASEEAQLLRFAAQASVKSTIEPSEGKIDIGIGAEASFALAEGAVGLTRYFPYESGYTLELSYLDANKQPAVYPFGHFRAKANLVLSCFIGAMANGRLELTNQSNENPGHKILLSPTVSMGTNASGGVGVKGDIFGGAQVGGQVEGGLEWKAPPDIKVDKVFDFATLAKVGANGNIAIGAGAGWDFQLSLERDGKFYFNCSGRLVFGPGASGGFGTTIDFEQLWKLAVILFKGLKATDYRVLDNINKFAYEHLVLSSYIAFASDLITDPTEALKQAVMNSSEYVNQWWRSRLDFWGLESEKKKEAYHLANRIIKGVNNKGHEVTGEIPFDELLPETVGMMLNTLVTTFYLSWEEKQETAIYYLLLGSVRNWRRFEEILSRMNYLGEKQRGDKALFDNLTRINTILDGEQQISFNDWVLKLAQENEVNESNLAQMRPFTPRSGGAWVDKRKVVEQQIARLNNNNGYYI